MHELNHLARGPQELGIPLHIESDQYAGSSTEATWDLETRNGHAGARPRSILTDRRLILRNEQDASNFVVDSYLDNRTWTARFHAVHRSSSTAATLTYQL